MKCPVKKFGLSEKQRLRSPLDFARVYQADLRAGDRYLVVCAAGNHLGHARFGVSVSRRHGNSVRRSRLKRLLREAFRLTQQELPKGLDLVLIPRQGARPTLADLQKSLKQAAGKLARRLAAREKTADSHTGDAP